MPLASAPSLCQIEILAKLFRSQPRRKPPNHQLRIGNRRPCQRLSSRRRGFVGYLIAHNPPQGDRFAMLAHQVGHPLPQKAMCGMGAWGSRSARVVFCGLSYNPALNTLCVRRLWSTTRRQAAASNGRGTWKPHWPCSGRLALKPIWFPRSLQNTRSRDPPVHRFRLRHNFCLRRRWHHPQHHPGASQLICGARGPASGHRQRAGARPGPSPEIGRGSKSLSAVRSTPRRARPSELFQSPGQPRHPLFCSRGRSRD